MTRLLRRSFIKSLAHTAAYFAALPLLQACAGEPAGVALPSKEGETDMQDHWFIVDAHIDIAYNALVYQRDYSQAARTTRQREAGSEAEKRNGGCTVGLPDLIRGQVGIVFGTLFVEPQHPNMLQTVLTYTNADEAYKHGMAQLDYYHQWAKRDKRVRVIGTKTDLDEVMAGWPSNPGPQTAESNQSSAGGNQSSHTVGLIPLMEGADPIREPKELQHWIDNGLRVVGLAWAATRYAAGTWQPGGLTDLGRELLKEIARLDVILDVSHLAQEALTQTLDVFEGKYIIASHSNPQHLVPTPRHLPDAAIKEIARRGGVTGVVLANAFLNANWGQGNLTHKEDVTVEDVVRVIDYSCQLVGNADHIGIGSDFDGGFGVQSVPSELDTSADLYKIGDALVKHGYAQNDIQKIMGGNWIRFLRSALK